MEATRTPPTADGRRSRKADAPRERARRHERLNMGVCPLFPVSRCLARSVIATLVVAYTLLMLDKIEGRYWSTMVMASPLQGAESIIRGTVWPFVLLFFLLQVGLLLLDVKSGGGKSILLRIREHSRRLADYLFLWQWMFLACVLHRDYVRAVRIDTHFRRAIDGVSYFETFSGLEIALFYPMVLLINRGFGWIFVVFYSLVLSLIAFEFLRGSLFIGKKWIQKLESADGEENSQVD
mgnify:CR=1 FL=1